MNNEKELLKKMDQIILLLKNNQFAYSKPTTKPTNKNKKQKRGNEMQRGSITYRNDGRWMGRCYDENGKQKCVYARTKKECSEKLKLVIDEVEQRKKNPQANSSMTLFEYFEYWFNTYRKPTLKESSCLIVERSFYRNLKSIGDLPIKNITIQMLQNIINSIDKIADRSLLYSNLNMLYEKLFFMGVVSQNIAGMIVLPKVEKNVIREIKEDEDVQILENGAENRITYKSFEKPYKYFIEFAINTGMRPAEILGLQKKDFNFINKTIAINKQFNLNTLKISPPKSKKGNRIIPMFTKTEEILKNMDIESLNDDDFVFKIKYTSIQKFLLKASKELGINVTCKTFRKTFSSRCQYLYGIDQKQVQMWLGHESSATTNKHYTFISKEDNQNNILKYNSLTHKIDT